MTLFYFDDQATVTLPDGGAVTGQWVPLPTTVDAAAGVATAEVDHFTPFALADGSSPSDAYLPSLQGWQVSTFTGATSFSYPIELPAGPAGLRPHAALTYSSAATDGKGGQRHDQQAGWVGKGWSLDLGSIALNKIGDGGTYYSLTLDGRSYTLVRGALLAGRADDGKPDSYEWRTADESYLKVRAEPAAPLAGRGGANGATPYQRYLWKVWARDGTRYEYGEDLWWGWNKCGTGISGNSSMEAYRWQLSGVVDPHGNAIAYAYERDSYAVAQACDSANITGTVDRDAWPRYVSWGGNATTGAGHRYLLNLYSLPREGDTAFDGTSNYIGGVNGAPRQTRKLMNILVHSMQGSAWELVRQYNLAYDYSLTSDESTASGGGYAGTGWPKLTLKSLQRVGNDGTAALPATTFTYGTTRGAGFYPDGGWNRLTGVDNGQGGTVGFAYESVWTSAGGNYTERRNWRRVTAKTMTDGRGNSSPWSYAYQAPALNSLGTALGVASATQTYPNSAALYLNTYWNTAADNTGLLVAKQYDEFRGHSWVLETAPDGAQTERWFYQGDIGCYPRSASGSPATGNAIYSNACFTGLRDRGALVGQVYKTRVKGAAAIGSPLLTETETAFAVDFLGYGPQDLAGLWHAWTRESDAYERIYEGGGTPAVKHTGYDYDAGNQAGVQAGNRTRTREYDVAGALYRATERWFNRLDDGVRYIVDRPLGEAVRDGANVLLADTNYFYDGRTTGWGVVDEGRLSLVRRYYDIPAGGTDSGVLLRSSDTSYAHDAYGNRTQETTYAGAGTRQFVGGAWTFSAPGGGSQARTVTTTYDGVFHAYPTRVDRPTGNGVTLTETAGYDWRMGTVTSVTDPNGQVTSAIYDVVGRRVAVIEPGDSAALPTTFVTYYDYEQPVRYLVGERDDPAGSGALGYRITSHYYDGLGRRIQTKQESQAGAQNIVTDIRYDGLGRVTQASQPRYLAENGTSFWYSTWHPSSPPPGAIAWTTTTYDALGRPRVVTAPDGTTTQTYYDNNGAAGRSTNTYDANNHVTRRNRDIFGRLVAVGEYSGNGGSEGPHAAYGATGYGYDQLDRLSLVQDAAGNVTTMGHDSLGRKANMSDPDMGAWAYDYDVNGNLTRQIDAKGQTVSFTYDWLNRLTARYGSDGSWSGFNYDEAGSPNGKGRRTSTATSQGVVMWSYDARGRVASQLYYGLALLPGQTRQIQWTYDSADRVRTVTYPNVPGATPWTLAYTYDDAWRPTSLCFVGGGCWVAGATYTALDQPATRALGNGVTEGWGYEPLLQRLASMTASGNVVGRTYTYDAVGNVRTVADTLLGQTETFGYDHRDRLTSAATAGSATGAYNQAYTYDAVGNLTSKAGAAYSYAGSGHAHAPSSFNGQKYTYDANGNLTAGGGRSIVWDILNRPTRVTGPDGVAEDYAYDADGARLTRARAGVTTLAVGSLWEEDVIGGATDTVRTYYPFAGRAVVVYENMPTLNTITYLHADHLGGVSVASDGGGAVVGRVWYAPWGEARAGDVPQTTLDFTGQKRDGTGLLYYNARYYDPALGKFISPDVIVPGAASGAGGAAATVGYDDGVALGPLTVGFQEPGFAAGLGDENRLTAARGFFDSSQKPRTGPANPQALNRYAYVLNNPVRYVDPTGHAVCGVTGCGSVVNESDKPVEITGDQTCEDGQMGCENGSRYVTVTLKPGQSSADLGMTDVDQVRAVDADTPIAGRGPGETYRIANGVRIVVRNDDKGGLKVEMDWWDLKSTVLETIAGRGYGWIKTPGPCTGETRAKGLPCRPPREDEKYI